MNSQEQWILQKESDPELRSGFIPIADGKSYGV